MPKQKGKSKNQADEKMEATTKQMQAKAAEVKRLYRRSVEGIVAAGEVLRGFEEQVVARSFKKFIFDHLAWSRTQVYRLMWVYDRFGKCSNLEHYDLSALYSLSAPSCPQKATDDAMKIATGGKHVTPKVAHELVVKYAQPTNQATQRTRSVLINKATLRKAATTRKIDLDKLVAVLKDAGVNLRWEEDATKKTAKEAA